jgi:hypothetical protein
LRAVTQQVLSLNPGNIASSTEMTDVPDLSRKTAMVAVSPPTDTADAPDTDTAAVSLEATSDEKAVSSEKQTPKADADEGRLATKDAESATSGKPDDPTPKSPKHDTEKKRADSPKQEPRRPTTSQRPKAPRKSNPLGWCLTDLKRSTARRRSAP